MEDPELEGLPKYLNQPSKFNSGLLDTLVLVVTRWEVKGGQWMVKVRNKGCDTYPCTGSNRKQENLRILLSKWDKKTESCTLRR